MLRIEIPGLPPFACSQNARLDKYARARAVKDYRQQVRYAAIDVRNRSECPGRWKGLDYARVDVTFVVPDNRRRDKTNMASAFKPALDGIVDAGILVDDSWQHCDDQYHVRMEKGQSRTIVEVSDGL
jgi:hypothetical protein